MKKGISRLLALAMLSTILSGNVSVLATEKTNDVKEMTQSVSQSRKRSIMYFPNWGVYDDAKQRLTPDMLPWEDLDVVNHSFFSIDKNFELISLDSYADYEMDLPHSPGWNKPNEVSGCFGEYKHYAKKYPNVRIMISVGGWTRGENFHAMAKTEAGRKKFIQSCINFMKKYPFIGGIDLDWEYPGVNRKADPNNQWDKGCPGGPEDTENYSLLLKEMREQFDAAGMKKKWITVCAPAGYDKMVFQEFDEFHKYVNSINVMTYDYHGAWDNYTGHLSPLKANPNNSVAPTEPVDIRNEYNVVSSVTRLLNDYKVPSEKLCIGTPWYSRGWAGVDANSENNGMFAKTDGSQHGGSWDEASQPSGQYPWYQLKKMENTNGWTKYRDEVNGSPWLYNEKLKTVLSYEDEESMNLKSEYIKQMNLGGMIVWEITGDDMSKGFPMTKQLRNSLDKPLDGDTSVQSAPTLSVDKSENYGSYTLTANVGMFSNGTKLEIFEDNKIVKTFDVDKVNGGNYTFDIVGKTPGKYSYKAVLTGEKDSKTSKTLDITVVDANLLSPSIDVDLKLNRGDFKITAKSPANSSATKLEIFENDKLIDSKELTATLNKEQIFVHEIKNKANGKYTYKVVVSDAKGNSLSKTIDVEVDSNASIMPTDIDIKFDVTSDWGSGANYKITITNNSSANITNYSLSFDSSKRIDSSWSGGTFKKVGNTYTITPASWSSTIPAGKSVTLDGAMEGNSKGHQITKINFDFEYEGGTAPNPPAPPTPDELKLIPAKVSANKVESTGDYNIRVTVPKNNAATSVQIFENDKVIKTVSLDKNANSDKIIDIKMTNKTEGTYTYKAVVSDGKNSKTSSSVKVTVKKDGETTPTPPTPEPEPNPGISAWTAMTNYSVGDKVTYNGKTYECRQPHMSLNGWEPVNVPALWLEIN